MSQSQVAPAFNALDGTELIEVVLKEIRDKLEATGEFKQHRGFPLIRVRYEIGINTYPTQKLDAEPGIKASGEVVVPQGETIPQVEPEKVVEVKDDLTIDTPDKARKKAGIKLKVPAPGPNKIHVDKPVGDVK